MLCENSVSIPCSIEQRPCRPSNITSPVPAWYSSAFSSCRSWSCQSTFIHPLHMFHSAWQHKTVVNCSELELSGCICWIWVGDVRMNLWVRTPVLTLFRLWFKTPCALCLFQNCSIGNIIWNVLLNSVCDSAHLLHWAFLGKCQRSL